MKQTGYLRLILLCISAYCLTVASSACADDVVRRVPTINMMGEMGLNTIPNARMSQEGTVRASVSRTAPYSHATLGIQLSKRLYLGLRQTSESDNFLSTTNHLYPGLDAKLNLFEERRFLPQISVGLQSALGHKRMAAEYLALSKRYHDFDFTFGFGWGRMASRSNLPNLLLIDKIKGGTSRALDGENPNTPRDWFTGDMGLFGGVEYNTAIDGLSLKADWNSDGWTAEKSANPNFKAPTPWSVGLSYRPVSWLDAGIAYAGNQSIMARLSLTPTIQNWAYRDAFTPLPLPMNAKRGKDRIIGEYTDDDDDVNNGETNNWLGLSGIDTDATTAYADIDLKDNLTTPQQIGQSSRYISNHAGKSPEQILLRLNRYGLKGQEIILNRTDVERAGQRRHGSSEEIWQTASFQPQSPAPFSLLGFLSRLIHGAPETQKEKGFTFDILNDVSLSEDDSGVLYRIGLRAGFHRFFGENFYTEQTVRINLANNLSKLTAYRGVSLFPVRGDVDDFSNRRIVLEKSFLTGFVTLGDDLHAATSAGYLEEMYLGLSGEILYRPFGKRWAVGAESALAFKRDPLTPFALGMNGDHVLTGFLNAYYEIPQSGVTLKASAGRYLAGDIGGSLELKNEFTNGVILSGGITATNKADADIYGGKTNVYTGIKLSLPLGSIPFTPDGSRFTTNAAPLGRDSAQRLDNPVPLYEITEPLSYRHITRHWGEFQPAQ